jgi:hypothetical protein
VTARTTLRVMVLSTTGLALLCPGLVHGQVTPSPNVPVTQRDRPEFDPLGIRAGSFLIFPSIGVSESYDTNVFATPDDEVDDFITNVEPRVEVVSDFPRHALAFSTGADVAFYASETGENYQDFFVNGDGQLDVTRDSVLTADVSAGRFHIGRDDPEDIGTAEPIEYWSYGGGLAYTHAFNRLNFRLTGQAEREDYTDTNGLSNDDRDVNEYDLLFRTGFLVSPRFNTFVEGRYNIEDRTNEDPTEPSQDSDGWEARVGTEVDITALLFGEAFVGYRKQYFDDEAFDSEDGFSFGVDLTWNPTTLTTVGLTGGADFEPTVQAGASSDFETRVALAVDHELLRNVLIGATAAYERDDFTGIDRLDETYEIGGRATYLLNRYLYLRGGYTFEDRTSDDPGEEFTDHLFTIGITAQL